jgi:hypothetical protein
VYAIVDGKLQGANTIHRKRNTTATHENCKSKW